MADLEISVFILGDSPASRYAFSVRAHDGTTVGTWKKSVYAEKQNRLKGYRAADFTLWKLNSSIPADEIDKGVAILGQNLSGVAVIMLPAETLSFYFPSVPARESLHVIAVLPDLPLPGQKRGRPPGGDAERLSKRLHTEHEEALNIARSKPTPSHAATASGLIRAQAVNPILNGRPFSAVGPPITIYEPVFSNFCAMNEGKLPVDVSPEDYEFVKAFMVASAKIYQSKKDKKSAITKPLEKLLQNVFLTVTLDDDTSNDGIIHKSFKENACLLLVREIDGGQSGAGDSCLRANFSYTRWWASALGSHFRDRTCCPSFLLAVEGSSICVLEGILAGKSWTVQPLTELVSARGSIDREAQGKRIGRLLCSLRVALDALGRRFEAVKDIPAPSPPPCFPFITSYMYEVTQIQEAITYKERLHCWEGQEGTAVFSATLENGDAVFIKFVTRYNEEAHRLLAREGYAPQLRNRSKLEDGGTHFMVVMDLIDGHDMHEQPFQEEDLSRVRVAKDLLHEHGYVFGDLRPNNIFKPTNGLGVMLVDFDWCGKADLDTYPLFINKDPTCNWHSDVRGDAIMRKVHDDHLFDSFRRS